MSLLFLHLLLIPLLTPLSASSTTTPDRFIKSIPQSLQRKHKPQEYLELTHPLPSDHLTPSCSSHVLHQDFGYTMGLPPVSVTYSPPSDCLSPWSHIVLDFQASCKGEQYDRIVGVWLGGSEILRTSTAEPTRDGIFWKVRKDVTRYASLLLPSNLTFTVMLENIVNDVFTGVYHVNISLLYYKDQGVRVASDHQNLNEKLGFVNSVDEESKLGKNSMLVYRGPTEALNLYETPADLIMPISGVRDEGFWFRIENESGVKSKGLRIPLNSRKLVLEVYVSFHGNDEFWYSNPPDSYIITNNLTTGRGNGAYREVFVTIDGRFVGSVVPFPVIFTGGINPLFWEPVVAIGAFNVPSYDLELTPFLGLLLDGKEHIFGLGVADSIPFWLVDANLHIWLDHGSSAVQARTVDSYTPAVSVERRSTFTQLDGSFRIDAHRKSRFLGWAITAAGNLTTQVLQLFKFKNSIQFHQNGTYKSVRQRVRTRINVRVKSDMGRLIARTSIKRQYPLKIMTATIPQSKKKDTYLMVTNVSHALREKSTHGKLKSSVHNIQDSRGWMMVKDHDVLSGEANTNQTLTYKDEFGCYSQFVASINGKLYRDNSSFLCASSI
ncbi:peptide-N4-(N-acetyl-beta-glucosaminyl)asparagine amidase A [Cornus florida]|uniref:peptide-N4-(N-acetyl-beta- glucosaminyl)asparagine amidase A n=1 Tax=Cornus florida TaxID=4283 RepID=UPI0028964598|nr:peptide-N4-(N-acetyl-beta-glucosaminyl)asparagine amidase A [Cornus florida]